VITDSEVPGGNHRARCAVFDGAGQHGASDHGQRRDQPTRRIQPRPLVQQSKRCSPDREDSRIPELWTAKQVSARVVIRKLLEELRDSQVAT